MLALCDARDAVTDDEALDELEDREDADGDEIGELDVVADMETEIDCEALLEPEDDAATDTLIEAEPVTL